MNNLHFIDLPCHKLKYVRGLRKGIDFTFIRNTKAKSRHLKFFFIYKGFCVYWSRNITAPVKYGKKYIYSLKYWTLSFVTVAQVVESWTTDPEDVGSIPDGVL